MTRFTHIAITMIALCTPLWIHAAPRVYDVSASEVRASIDRQRLFASMQGIGARQDQWLFLGTTDGGFWADRVRQEGVTYVSVSTWTGLLDACTNLLQRYVLYDPSLVDGIPKNAEVAFAMAGLSNAVVVTPAIESDIQSRGGQKILDVRTWNWANVPMSSLSADWFGNVQTDRTTTTSYVADFCVANTAAWRFVPPTGPPGEPGFFDHFAVGATFLGWFFGDEGDAVTAYSQRGMYTIPADWMANLAPLSRSAPAVSGDIRQPIRRPEEVADTNIHLVAIFISDGDNMNVWKGMYRNNNFWNSGCRGDFPVNWTYPPRIASLARIAHKYYCNDATTNDLFVSGPSGAGYYYPDRLADSASRGVFAHADNRSMDDADISVWCPMFKDDDFSSATTILEEMLDHMPAVNAVFPMTYGGAYKNFGGAKAMVRGIPVMTPGYSLWSGFDTPQQAAQTINSKPTGVCKDQAYSVVFVHMWSYDLEDIATDFVANLSSHVRVVDAWTLADTYARHVGNFGMVRNGTVEAGSSWPDDWYHHAAQAHWTEEKSVSPTHSLKMADALTTDNADWRSDLFALPAPTRSFEFSWHWCYSGLQGTWQAGIRWYTNNTTDSFIGEELYSPAGAEQAGFVRESRTVIPPAEARYADVTFRSWENPSVGTMWVDNVSVRIAEPYMSLDTTRLVFHGTIGVPCDETVIVSNAGEGILMGAVTNVASPFSVVSGAPYSLTNNTYCDITIRFLSDIPGAFTNEVLCTGGGSASLQLIGEAIPEPAAWMLVAFLCASAGNRQKTGCNRPTR